METTGRLTGPQLTCPGGNAYRAGDHVVTLAPGPNGTLVTSQPAVIAAVDTHRGTLTLRTDDGQQVQLDREDAGADRLGYGYATTVHRGQGATNGRAHLFADGGGRELAYVAMSRAKESTHIWTVADDLPQAVDDLRRDWSTRRTPLWAIDTALPDPASLNSGQFRALPSGQQARIAALLHAEKATTGRAVTGVRLPDRAATLGQAEQVLESARRARADLDHGGGVWASTEAGQAVRDLAVARAERERAEWNAEHGGRWRDRHGARKEAAHWAAQEADAQARWQTHAAPERARLDHDIARHQAALEGTAQQLERRKAATTAVRDHGFEAQRHATNLAARLDAHRDHIDGLPSAAEIRRAATRQQQPRDVTRAWPHEPPTVRPPGPEL